MRLHDTHELVLRARSHVREDHVKQGTYGDAKLNGDVQFKGCAIGCLSTPHRADDIIAFLKANRGSWVKPGSEFELTIDSDEQRALLAEEFGICNDLAVVAEGFFEVQRTHGAALEFVREFAEALVEGSEIVPSQVAAWLYSHLDRFEAESYGYRTDESYYDEIEEKVNSIDEGDTDPRTLEELTAEFLTWLRARSPLGAGTSVTSAATA